MKVNSVNSNYNSIYLKPQNNKKVNDAAVKEPYTSIYDKKGMNIYFCGLAKGVDVIEEECIKLLRKERSGRCRKFTEPDIQDMITSLKKCSKSDDKPVVVQEVLLLEDELSCEKPDKNLIKQLVKVLAGKNEKERYGVLEYAENELKTATEPFGSFARLSNNNQAELIKILSEISDVNEKNLYKSNQDRETLLERMYDLFRMPVYAHEDLSKLSAAEANDYKIEAVKTINHDLNWYKESDIYTNENAKNKVVSIANNILNYFIENIM